MGRQARRVLVVDDDADFRDAVAQILGGLGYAVQTARDGQEALDVLMALRGEARPSLVLLDVAMPRMGGDTLRARIKAMPQFASIPVVMISGESGPGRIGDPFEGFLLKPLDLDTLLGVAGHYCGVEPLAGSLFYGKDDPGFEPSA